MLYNCALVGSLYEIHKIQFEINTEESKWKLCDYYTINGNKIYNMYPFGTLIKSCVTRGCLQYPFLFSLFFSNSRSIVFVPCFYHQFFLFPFALEFSAYLFLSIDRKVAAVATEYDGNQASRRGTKPLLPDAARLNTKPGCTMTDILSVF
jgi:hypothetical protein